jgi:2-methylcitrate dehydratase PrpD
MHASVSATAQILEEHSLRVEDIESIVALAGEAGVRMVLEPLADKHRPRTEYDAKFSLPYSVASLIVRGVVDVATYTDAALRDEEVLALAGKVTYEVKEYATAADAFPGGIRILTRDGRTLEADLEYQRGAPENPMGAEEVVEKFRSNAALALSAEDTLTLEESVMGLEDHAGLGALRVLGRASVKEEVAA